MFSAASHELLNVVITLEALECSLPASYTKDKKIKPQYVTMIIKRGEQQREETDPKLAYEPIDPEN